MGAIGACVKEPSEFASFRESGFRLRESTDVSCDKTSLTGNLEPSADLTLHEQLVLQSNGVSGTGCTDMNSSAAAEVAAAAGVGVGVKRPTC